MHDFFHMVPFFAESQSPFGCVCAEKTVKTRFDSSLLHQVHKAAFSDYDCLQASLRS